MDARAYAMAWKPTQMRRARELEGKRARPGWKARVWRGFVLKNAGALERGPWIGQTRSGNRGKRKDPKNDQCDKAFALTDGKACSKMMELAKEVRTSLLLDFYGQTLTGKQREVMELYYNEDLSLSEIAENQGISRQAALDSIRRAEKHLEGMESGLGMLEKYQACTQAAAEIERLARGAAAEREILAEVRKIRAVWEDS